MVHSILIRLGPGNLDAGFDNVQVQLKIPKSDEYFPISENVRLPPSPSLSKVYKEWKYKYREILSYQKYQFFNENTFYPRLDVFLDSDNQDSLRFSVAEFNDHCRRLTILLNEWLNSESFQLVGRRLYQKISEEEEIHVLIEVHDIEHCQLPWHLWNFFSDYNKSDVSFCLPKHNIPISDLRGRSRVRILAVIGEISNVDIEGDLYALRQFSNTELVTLIEPSRKEFAHYLWDEQGWDILFYGGHSNTLTGQGYLYLNSHEKLTLSEFSEAIKEMISRGTVLAIFNSCDGLGLAQLTTELGMPATLVMLQAIPNGVAVTFVRYFLNTFIKGASCYKALKEARRRLTEIENKFPCASWMPGMFRNPTVPAPTWKQMLLGPYKQQEYRARCYSLVFGVTISVLTIFSSLFGLLQVWEWGMYDKMITLRPAEPVDDRLLIVKVNSEDLQRLDRSSQLRQNFLPEAALEQLLEILKQDYKPRLVGIDFKQQAPIKSRNLKNSIQQDHIFSVCGTIRRRGYSHDVVAPPPNIDSKQIGFSDFWPDRDHVLRRFVYEQSSQVDHRKNKNNCSAKYSFSLLIALAYLEQEDKHKYMLTRTEESDLRIGLLHMKTIQSDFGSYQMSLGESAGWQVMLNYRAGERVARSVSLTQVLEHQIDPKILPQLQNRIILIGGDIADHHITPTDSKVPGVEIHAHMVSQILSAVLDDRNLLSTWPSWLEWFWITFWSLIGGLLAWLWRRPMLMFGIFILATTVLLTLGYYLLLMNSTWVPIAAPLCGISFTSFGLWTFHALAKLSGEKNNA